MEREGHLRYFAIEVAVSALISAVFGGAFTFILLGFDAGGGPFDRRAIALDFFPQTFMTALMSYIIPAFLTRARLRKGRVRQFRTGSTWTNSLPFVWQSVLVPPLSTLTFGVAAALLVYFYVPLPNSIWGIALLKMSYSAMLAALFTSYAIFSALSCDRLRVALSDQNTSLQSHGS